MVDASACNIECSDQPLDVSFHPIKSSIVAAALVDGTVEVHDYQEALEQQQNQVGSNGGGRKNVDDNDNDDDDEVDTIISSTKVHTQLIPSKTNTEVGYTQASCRAVLFGSNGNEHLLYTGGSAGDIRALDTERLCTFTSSSTGNKKSTKWYIPDASKSPINILYEYQYELASSRPLLVSGDDTGGVRIWDNRLVDNQPTNADGTITSNNNSTSSNNNNKNPTGCVVSWKKHTDYISGFDQSQYDVNNLLACSADGHLSIYDIRMASSSTNQSIQEKDKAVIVSDEMDDELLSIACMKYGKKVLCGTTEGIVNLWNYGMWDDICNRFTALQSNSIDTLLKLDEDTVLTGSSDGLIRVVAVDPNKLLGIFGDTYSHSGYPIEKLVFDCSKRYVGSITHDNYIRLWDTKILKDDDDDDNNNNNKVVDGKVKTNESRMKNLRSVPEETIQQQQKRDSDDEWDDMDDSDDNDAGSDMDNDDDDVAMKSGDDDNSDDDSDDDDDDGNEGTNTKRTNALKSERERFFDDL